MDGRRRLDHTLLLSTLWTLTFGQHTCRAELWALQGVAGFDLRYSIDGEMRETELFKGVDGGTRATLAALDKKDELRQMGWL